MRGMTACPLLLKVPNPDKLTITEIRPIIIEGVRTFFESADFRILQFNDWRVVRGFGPEQPDGGEPASHSLIEVLIMVSWNAKLSCTRPPAADS